MPRTHNVAAFAQAIRAIGEPIHGQPAETISMARLLTLLFEVTELFDMQTRPELVLLQKTMVVVEGVARTLDPAFNMWKTAEPVVGDWIARQSRSARPARPTRATAPTRCCRWPARRPSFAARTERLSREIDAMAEHGLRFDDATATAIGKAEARHTRSGRVALWVIALTLVWIAWQLSLSRQSCMLALHALMQPIFWRRIRPWRHHRPQSRRDVKRELRKLRGGKRRSMEQAGARPPGAKA